MTDRDILDQIDNVITWDGRSPDAMRWTAQPPTLPELHLNIDATAAQQAFARLGEQVQAFVDAFRPVAEQVMRNVAAMAKTFGEIMPQIRELEQEQRRARSAMKSEYNRRGRRRSRRR